MLYHRNSWAYWVELMLKQGIYHRELFHGLSAADLLNDRALPFFEQWSDSESSTTIAANFYWHSTHERSDFGINWQYFSPTEFSGKNHPVSLASVSAPASAICAPIAGGV